MHPRRPTATSNFGVSRRESHDASSFYERFSAPCLSDDSTVLTPRPVEEPFLCGDSRSMPAVEDGSVALVVTSPPYFAGKEYEEELGRRGVPATYLEYLGMLRDVFAECARKLEPGGRIAVNVANLGRKPYRSLSSDVITILQDDLGLLLRGEVIWQKAEGASGSCAWGSYRSAANPVLRDLTERVVVASKGRFDRARTAGRRAGEGLPHESTLMADDFMALTVDVWHVPAESARRVGHPAPFPVELPERLIDLYTFRDDLVLDPFMGSGSALVAAARRGRRYVGYDLDPSYVALARCRVEAAATPEAVAGAGEDLQAAARREGMPAQKLGEGAVAETGFTVVATNQRVPGTGVTVSVVAVDARGERWFFDVPGPFTGQRGGLARMEAVWASLGRAHALRGRGVSPLVLLATPLPARPGPGNAALRAAGPGAFFDAVDPLSEDGRHRLEIYAKGGTGGPAQIGFWTAADLAG